MSNPTYGNKTQSGLSRAVTIVAVVVIIIIFAVGGVVLILPSLNHTTTVSQVTTISTSASTASSSAATSVTTTSPIVTSTSATSTNVPTTFTWETTNTITQVDPNVAYDPYGSAIDANVYESLLWFNQSSPTQLIPWLAQSFTASPDHANWNFTLRSGITFADGNPLNASAVYFSFYRMLLTDGSSPTGYGTQFAFDIQQFLNTSLSSVLCCAQTYNAKYVQEVLAQNFVQITGPMTFNMHLINPGAEFAYVIAGYNWGAIIDPTFVMQHDLALWNQSSSGYHLPYPQLSGSLSNMMQQYFLDEVATCGSGITPQGCGTTYLDGSYQGSLAGTGPYTLQSVAQDSSLIVFQANPNYWGGAYQFMGGQKIVPTFKTLQFKYVPSLSTREIDLKNAALSGQAVMIDVPPSNLYDVANRNSWTQNGTLNSIIPGVTLWGPYQELKTNLFYFGVNVTNALTGDYYKFQPFADIRFRLALADSVNMTVMNQLYNNNLGSVAQNLIPPGLAPAGVYNPSIEPVYNYNLTAVGSYLLDAMLHPLTKFTFTNGTAAPTGFFNNTFGCPALNSQGQCTNPIAQTITMSYPNGRAVQEAIFNQMASVLNGISSQYNMGLSFVLQPLPIGQLYAEAFSGYLYFRGSGGYGADYNYVLNFLAANFPPGSPGAAAVGWNLTAMGPLYQQAVKASASGNLSGLIQVTNQMNELANQEVMYMYTFYPAVFYVTTSVVQGFQFNPALDGNIYGVNLY
ncbi:MAG: ABC transporter substrate-binding protein [Nitrososphaerales archaeon]